MPYAIVDIETTGGNYKTGKITEVAIILHNGKEIEGHYETLVNPMEPIPPFITRLTGISDNMVQSAPTYGDVAWMIDKLLYDRIFVAHNVMFDYSFIRQEFSNVGMEFSSDRLCTIRCSRKFMPGYKSYSLGNLCKEVGIDVQNRHRAAGDALATAELFGKLSDVAGRSLLRQVVRGEFLP